MVHILYYQDCANQFRSSHCQGEKDRTVCTRLRVSFSLDLQTRERKLRTLITMKDGHMMGYVIFPWYQLARGFTKLGSWERWDREGRRWMNCACWPEGTVPAGLRELCFPPRKVCGMNNRKAFSSPMKTKLKCLPFWWGSRKELEFEVGALSFSEALATY